MDLMIEEGDLEDQDQYIEIRLTREQLEWLGQVFLDSHTDIKIHIDPEATFEQQLADAGAFDHEEAA
jgi:hypothetical protein